MKKMMTRSLTAGVAIAALALTGCSASDDTDDAAEDGPVTLEFWGWVSGVDQRVATWNEEHPDIQVNFTNPAGGEDFPVKVLSAVRAGEGPDIAQSEYSQLPTFVTAGVTAPLDDEADQFADAYSQAVIDSVSFDGSIRAYPIDLGPVLDVYRSDLYDELGLTAPTTWDEFRATAEAVRAMPGDHYLANFSSADADLFMGLALQAGAQWWTYDADDGWTVDIDDDATQQVLDFWQGMVEDDLVSTYQTDSPEYIEAFTNGQILSQFAGAWAPGPLLSRYPDTVGKWTAAQVPQWDAADPITFARGGASAIVLDDSPHKAQAIEFLTWLSATDEGGEGLVEVGKFTANTHGQEIDRAAPELMPEDETYWPSAAESAQHLKAVQWGPNTQVAFTAINDALGGALNTGDWSDVLPSIQKTVEDDLK